MRAEVLSEEDIARIDSASMAILQRPGVAIFEKQSLDLLEEKGASIDRMRSIARIPEGVVRGAIEIAPKKYRLAARDSSKSVTLGSGRTHFTNSATGIRVLDHISDKIRDSVLSDISQFARVADSLSHINIYGPTVVAHDVKDGSRFPRELLAALEHTTKHVSHESHGTEITKLFVRISQIVAGGDEEFRKNPLVSAGGCPVSPLQFDRMNTEAMIECARAGMPFDVLSMAMGGGTSPITLAGELAIINAEVLTGIALCELANPGTPVIYGSVASVMDMRSGVLALGAPERAVLNVAVVQMAHHYGIPCEVGGISTDAKMPGDQAMFEKTLTGLPVVLAGSDIVFGPAVLSSATTYSLEQLVMDDEVAGALLRVRQGMETDEDSLALDLTQKIGPGGQFIGTRHTHEHMQSEVWRPALADRNFYDKWAMLGGKDMRSRAKDRVLDIIDNHEVLPLEREQRREIDSIIEEAAKLPPK